MTNNITWSYLLILIVIGTFASCSEDSVEEKLSISFESSSTEVSEGPNSIFIPLKLSGSSNKEVFVTYEVSGTADFPGDVVPMTSTNFVIPSGATAYNMEMLIAEDAVVELDPEQLIIELISASDGGELGSQTEHTLNIAADDVPLASFSSATSSVVFGEDVDISFELSKSYDSDLTFTFDFESVKDDSSEPMYFDIGDITIPKGELSANSTLNFNQDYSGDFTGDEAVVMSIESITSSFVPVADVVADPDQDNHIVAVSGGSFEISLIWTSSDEDVDLDLHIVDENFEKFYSSENAGIETGESLTVPFEFEDGDYSIEVSFVSGTPSDFNAELTITTTGLVTSDLDGYTFEMDGVNVNEGILLDFSKSEEAFVFF